MKYILIIAVSWMSMVAQANQNCASNESQSYKIENLTELVDLFGTWKGTHDGEPFIAVFSKKSNGDFAGKLTLGTKVVGPTSVKVCDYGTEFSLVVYWQEAELKVINSKKVEITLPFEGNPKVTVTKQKS